jgi:acyl-CoA thioesterase-1
LTTINFSVKKRVVRELQFLKGFPEKPQFRGRGAKGPVAKIAGLWGNRPGFRKSPVSFGGFVMKRFFLYPGIAGVCLIIGLAVTGCDNGTANRIVHDYTTLVCFGNSLTAGYGATTPGRDDKAKSYPAYLQGKVNIPVVNAGVSGNTTMDALRRINTDVLSKDPLIVIIELGANDLFQMIPLTDTRNNLQAIISILNDGNRKIYIAKFYTEAVAREMANSVGLTDYAVQTALIQQYDTMFKTLALSNNAELIEDIWGGVWSVHMSDIVHPDAQGYEIMADNIYNAIKPYLQSNDLLK